MLTMRRATTMLALVLPAVVAMASPVPSEQIEAAITFSASQLTATATSGISYTQYPIFAKPGEPWALRDRNDWTSGMLPGCFWLLHRMTGDEAYAAYARAWAAAIRPSTTNGGFKVYPAYRPWFEYDGNLAAWQKVIDTAELQETVYVSLPLEDGTQPGARGMFPAYWRPYLGDFPESVYTAGPVDRMLDMPMLLWAARQTGDARTGNLHQVLHAICSRSYGRIDRRAKQTAGLRH